MFTLCIGYLVAQIVVGGRTEGITRELFGGPLTGQDETDAAENKISTGWASVGGIWGLIEYWVGVRLSQRIGHNLRTRLFARLTRLPMATLTEKRTGDSIYRVLSDTASIPLASLDMALTLFFSVLAALINMYLIRYSYQASAPELVWIAWSVMPLVFIATFPASKLMRRINETKRSAGSATTNVMEETVGNIEAVQSLGGMQTEVEKFNRRSLESYFRERIAMVVGLLVIVAGGIPVVAVAVYVFILVTDRIFEGVMSPGDLGVLFAMFFGIVLGAIEIGVFWLNLQSSVAPARRIFFFIDYPSDDDQAAGSDLSAITKGVRIEHVDYVYPDGTQALKDVTLEARLGETIALVGPSGAGKRPRANGTNA